MKFAFVFPGQGSQTVGMLSGHDSREVAQTFEQASDALGWNLAEMVREGPAERLNQTDKTQPALLAAGIAVWRVWQSRGLPQPSALAGHSLGEYSALVAAGSLDFAKTLKLVELRGQLMQAAVPAGTGGMAAVIGMEDEAVDALCRAFSDAVLEPANFNAPGQVVVAGEIAGLDWLDANGKSKGARMVKRLAMSVPSHCSLMQGASEELADALASMHIAAPQIPVRHNLDGQIRSEPSGIRDALTQQLFRPVRWTQTVSALQGEGVTHVFECGPGKVLVGLNKRIDKSLLSIALEDATGMDQAAAALSP